MKKCPYCAEDIKSEAIKCRYCHSDLGVKTSDTVKHGKTLTNNKNEPNKKSTFMFYLKYYAVYFIVSYFLFSIANDGTIGIYFLLILIFFPLPFFIKWNELSERKIKEKNRKKGIINNFEYTPEYNTKWEFLNIFKKKSITRLEFSIWGILSPIVLFIIWLNMPNFSEIIFINFLIKWFWVFWLTFSLFTYYISVSKRISDINKSSIFFLLAFIPSINIFVIIYLISKKGNRLKY